MRIGIDIDDTISDTYEVAFAYAQLYTINDLKRDATILNKASMHHSYLKDMHNWSQEEEKNFWLKYYPQILKQVKPLTFVQETIKKLKEDGNEIVFITARWPGDNYDITEYTENWLKKYNIEHDKLFQNVKDKAKIAQEQKIDLFIDDSFKNCQEVSQTGIKTFMIETRTNKGLDIDNVTRVYSWLDIYDKIEKSKNKREEIC